MTDVTAGQMGLSESWDDLLTARQLGLARGKAFTVADTPTPEWDAAIDAAATAAGCSLGPHRDIQKFETGATRDSDTDKLDYEGFLSPLVIKRYAQYMHKHRVQADGSLRDSDNWQKGIPLWKYMKSFWRHFWDTWFLHREGNRGEEIEDALCGDIFNASGYLHEILKEKKPCDTE